MRKIANHQRIMAMNRTLQAKLIWNAEIEKGILFAIHHLEK